jgi:hypothetical protein
VVLLTALVAPTARMPTSVDDQARLPPLTPYDEVAERQRLADMKAFRQYLVETGAVKCLVKMYQHTAKNEMRLDNPRILKEFLENHIEDPEAAQEAEQLSEENAILKDRQVDLQAQVESLTKELELQRRLAVGNSLWRYLVSVEFWEGELDEDARAEGLPLSLFYRRFCGQKVDKATRKVLVNLIRPPSYSEKELERSSPIPLEKFSHWVATGIPDSLHDWCRDDLLPRFSSVPVPTEPPFEREILQAIRNTGLGELSPDSLDDVGRLVSLDANLLAFLNGAAEIFN